METSTNSILSQSALKILRPLVRVMLRNGISCGSIEELVRKAYVEEAFTAGEKNSQKTTVSSVSAQTGLSRKEVKRITEMEENPYAEIEQKYNRAIRVISGWSNESTFTDAKGNAKALPLDGINGSFASLVKQFSGDIPPRAMLDLLVAADCVTVKDNMVHLIKHAYVPGKDSAEIIRILGADTNELINTIDYNLSALDGEKRYQRKVSSAVLDKNAIDAFKELSKNKSQALLEELDAWLMQHETNPGDQNAQYVSLGIYYYEK